MRSNEFRHVVCVFLSVSGEDWGLLACNICYNVPPIVRIDGLLRADMGMAPASHAGIISFSTKLLKLSE